LASDRGACAAGQAEDAQTYGALCHWGVAVFRMFG